MKDVKCFYCEYLALETKTSGRCHKDKQTKQIAVVRDCKIYRLAPIDNVKWRREQIKK